MLAIEEMLDRELLESEIEAVTTVADVEKLLSSG
jgi:acyl carrier protein